MFFEFLIWVIRGISMIRIERRRYRCGVWGISLVWDLRIEVFIGFLDEDVFLRIRG